MANLIPMAGLGSRFAKEGYKLPKALVPVSGMPMIVRAIRGMPPSDKWIFVVRKEHVDDFKIDRVIRSEIPNAIIIPVEKTTEGQACTCMLGQEHLDPEEPLFIAACDTGSLYDTKTYGRLCNDPAVDSIVWTFTRREAMRRTPQSFGWCRVADDGLTLEDMSVKVPISDDPYNDHAIVASFWFKYAKDFIGAVNDMIREDYRIKNEFYVDAVPLFLKKRRKRSVIFDVELFFGWGTPAELYEYQFLEYVCRHGCSAELLDEEDRKLLPLWKRYFKSSV